MAQPQRVSEPSLDFRIRGMDCAEECAILRSEIGPVVGGDDKLSFDILRGRMTVSGAASIAADVVIKAVARTGMRAEVWTADDETRAPGEEARAQLVLERGQVDGGVFSLRGRQQLGRQRNIDACLAHWSASFNR